MRGRRWDGEENVMEIKVAKTAGFCFGVNRAVELTYGLLAEGRRVATLGPLIHNRHAGKGGLCGRQRASGAGWL